MPSAGSDYRNLVAAGVVVSTRRCSDPDRRVAVSPLGREKGARNTRSTRSATVVAVTPMRLLVIKRRDFSTLLREAPELTQSILATLSRRVRQAEQALGS